MQPFLLLGLLSSVISKECSSHGGHCDSIENPTTSLMAASFYSEPNYGGDNTTILLRGHYGCHRDVPTYIIRSVGLAPTTKIFLHYGHNCTGRVMHEIQGNKKSLRFKKGCPVSVFLKYNDPGSCH